MSAVQFTLGADPEIFVKRGNKPVSAYGLIEGTKESPLKTDSGAVQVDGMALEFNIDPVPLHDANRFNINVLRTMRDLKEMVKGLSFNISPVQEFGQEFLDEQPDEAKELGCDPDFSAYTLQPNPRPDGSRTFRTGAGHVHFGWDATASIPVDNEEHLQICADFVKMCDATIGMYMTVLDRDPRRRELYGKAGAFRPKPYGVEYRTPSNMWIATKARRMMLHAMCRRAVALMQRGLEIKFDAQEIIDTGNWREAAKVLEAFQGSTYGSSGIWSAAKKDINALYPDAQI